MNRRLMITVDVEAQPRRANKDHVETLIYGRLHGADFGIGKMMSIAEKHDAKLTCFLDYAEEYLYGDKLLAVGREIHARGHDLQIHMHPEFLPRELFKQRGLKYFTDMFLVEEMHARFFIETAMDSHAKVAAASPIAFRGGGFRYGEAILRALKENGLSINSSYNPSKANQPFNIGGKKQFSWKNGVVELPISCVFDFKGSGRLFDYNFNASTLMNGTAGECVQKHIDYLAQFYNQFGDDAIAVMVLHSWSFLNRDQDEHYSSPNYDAVSKFDLLLAALANQVSLVTTADEASLISAGMPGDVVEYPHHMKMDCVDVTAPTTISPANKASCEICGTDVARFLDYNGPRRKCPECGSLERQRAFASLYQTQQVPGLELEGKKILLISPNNSEIMFFGHFENSTLQTLDIREEVRPDVVADICDMPHIANASFDIAYACHVLSHVYDLEACLSEIKRILKPGGIFVNHEPVSKGRTTKDITDLSEICRHYGVETYAKYRVGRFRTFGELDIKSILSSRFEVDLRRVIDNPSGMEIIWTISRRIVACSTV